MSGMSPELREFVLASRSAILPTEADSARIIEGLRARLGDAALVGTETAHLAAKSASTKFLFLKTSFMSLAGLAVLGGVWYLAAGNSRAVMREANGVARLEAAASATVAPASSTTTSSPVISPEPEATGAAVIANPIPDGDRSRPVASRPPQDRLAQEVAIISRAEAALRGGRPTVALEILNEHERKFGNGLLAEERIAASAQALRALGRNAEADAQLTQLSPKSLHRRPSR